MHSVVRILNEVTVSDETREVVNEQGEETRADNRTLRDATRHREGKLPTAHNLFPTGQIWSEPLDIDTIPFQLGEKDAMVDAVERLRQIDSRYRWDVAVIDVFDEALDSDEHGVLRRMLLPVRKLHRADQVTDMKVGTYWAGYMQLFRVIWTTRSAMKWVGC